MSSSSFPHGLDGFDRLDIGDEYDMAPRTRQQSRSGAHYSEGEFFYTVNIQLDDESSSEVLHTYDLPFELENPEPLRQALTYQGKNLSHDIKVSQANGRIQFDFWEKISVWVEERSGHSSSMQCNCSHQTRVTACKVRSYTNIKNTG